jgi:pimeloyl-ACP methyl ester carboxylesterase
MEEQIIGILQEQEPQHQLRSYAASTMRRFGATVVVGHSMGGMIILQLAAAHQDCVAAMVMVESTLVFSPEQRTAFEVMAAGIDAGDQQPRTQSVRRFDCRGMPSAIHEHRNLGVCEHAAVNRCPAGLGCPHPTAVLPTHGLTPDPTCHARRLIL